MTHLARRFALVVAASATLGLSSDRVDAAPRGASNNASKRGPVTFDVATGKGAKQVVAKAPPAAPKPLSNEQRTELLRGFGVSDPPNATYAHASPGRSNIPGRMSLVFVGASVVNGSADFVSFPGYGTTSPTKLHVAKMKDPQFAGLWIKSEHPGARYLVECGVSTDHELGLGLEADGNPVQFQIVAAGSSQVAWLVDSPDAQWHSYELQGASAWSMHGCKATRVP